LSFEERIVGIDPGCLHDPTSAAEIGTFLGLPSDASVEYLGLPGQALVRIQAEAANRVWASFESNPKLLYTAPNTRVQASATPNDPQFALGNQLALQQAVQAPQAWDLTTGSSRTIVGLIDSGIDPTHPDLYLNIWINQGEIPNAIRLALTDTDGDRLFTFYDLNDQANAGLVADSNSNGYIDARDLLVALPNGFNPANGANTGGWADRVDNDNSGKIDDLYGWDFLDNDNDPFDANGHGTFVGSVIAAIGNNGIGTTGTAWRASIMPLRFLGENKDGEIAAAIAALNYTTFMRKDRGVQVAVTNNSYIDVTGTFNQAHLDAIKASGDADVLFVAAAGNGSIFGSLNLDITPTYPAAYDATNMITVAATNELDELWFRSNFGRAIDIAAPGVGIVGASLNGGLETRDGTSVAAGFVTGVASLVASLHQDATVTELRNAVLRGANTLTQLIQVPFGRRLNALGALTVDTFAPRITIDPIPDVFARGPQYQTVTATYTDDTRINLDTLGNGDLVVTRLTGGSFNVNAELVSKQEITGGARVTYRFPVPGGNWDAADSGDYSVRLRVNEVADVHGQFAKAIELDRFTVQIAPITGPFIVNLVSDAIDINLGDGEARGADGKTSLRAAVMEANALAEIANITLPAGTYTFSIAGRGEDKAATGDLDVTRNLTIRGASSATTIIDAAGLDRVFQVLRGVTLTLQDLTVRGGNVTGGDDGGGVFTSGTLVLNNVVITDNHATHGFGDGGGVYGDESSSLQISGTLITNNEAKRTGGGIHAGGTISVTQNSQIIGNKADLGGGLFKRDSKTAGVLDSTNLSRNIARLGAGVHNTGELVIRDVVIAENRGAELGGGIFHQFGKLDIARTTIRDHGDNTNKGASRNGGGIYTLNGQISISASTISGNSAGIDGGGIFAFDSNVSLINSTISGNEAVEVGGGILHKNGGLSVEHVTVTANKAGTSGGGIASAGATSFLNSILAGNTAPAAPDGTNTIRGVSGTAVSGGGNIVGNNASFTLNTRIDDVTGTPLSPVDPILAPLSDNGGPTRTHALLPGSPAIDYVAAINVVADQRGTTRPIDGDRDGVGKPDAGSVEFGDAAIVVNSVIDTRDLNPGDGIARDQFGNTTLRAATQEASAESIPRTILLGAATYTLSLQSGNQDSDFGDLDVLGDLTIVGAGADKTFINAANIDRVFEVNPGAKLTLIGVTLRNGTTAEDGGGIFNRGMLTVVETQIETNAARSGGGIYNAGGTLAINRSTLATNQASASGGALANATGAVSVINSTISTNAATVDGGGIWNAGSLSLESTTIAANGANVRGNGIFNASAGTLSLHNTLLAANPVAGSSDGFNEGTMTSHGYNLIGNNNQFAISGNVGDRLGTAASPIDPTISSLRNNGGSTSTHALLTGSPAIDTGELAATAASDQRGIRRPHDGDVVVGALRDIGAFELFEPGSISGTVFHDLDGDGVTDPGENLALGIRVFLDLNRDGKANPGEPIQITNGSGGFSFLTLEPHEYAVTLDLPRSHAASFPLSAFQTYNLQRAETAHLLPFGIQQIAIAVPNIISSHIIWASGTGPYVVSDNLVVESGASLRIEAGVQVLFESGASLRVDGVLDVDGTAPAPVAFASIEESPDPSELWAGLELGNSVTESDAMGNWLSGTRIRHAVIRGASVGLLAKGSGFFVEDVRFEDNVIGLEVWGAGDAWIHGATFTENETGARLVSSTVHVRNSEFARNPVGMLVVGNAALDMTGSEFKENQSAFAVADRNVYTGNLTIDHNVFDLNGISFELGRSGELRGSTILISNNLITRGTSSWFTARQNWWDQTLRIESNIVADNAGGLVATATTNYARTVEFRDNVLIRNGGGLQLDTGFPWVVTGNVFSGNLGVLLDAVAGEFTGNNIISHENETYVLNDRVADVVATGNFWGPDITSALLAGVQNLPQIHDFLDAPEVGRVNLSGFSGVPLAGLPLSAPSGLTANVADTSIDVSWDTNPESGVTGYRIYWDRDNDFNYANVVTVPANTTAHTINNLSAGQRYFVSVTAIRAGADDPDGSINDPRSRDDQILQRESWFSEIPENAVADIHGSIFHDRNNNGSFENEESTLSGWTVYLDLNKNGQFDAGEPQAISDTLGRYAFKLLPPKTAYVITQIPAPGWVSSVQAGLNSRAITVGKGAVITGLNFGNVPLPGVIRGAVFVDLNANRIKDTGEIGFRDFSVFLDLNGNEVLDSGEPLANTDSNGQYVFTNVPPQATYTIVKVSQAGWDQTFPEVNAGVGSRQVTVGAGQTVDRLDFGVTPDVNGILVGANANTGLRGVVFDDFNKNGRRDPGEPGVPNVEAFVDLNGDGIRNAGDLVTRTQQDLLETPDIDESGFYGFLQLGNGTYSVGILRPDTWSQTSPLSPFFMLTSTSKVVSPISTALAAINGGRPDLIVANIETNDFTVAKNDGTGVLPAIASVKLSSAPAAITTADFDGDQDTDIAVLHNKTGSSQISIFLNNNGTLTPGATLTGGRHGYSLIAGNFNGDTYVDLIAAYYGSQNILFYAGQNGGSFAVPVEIYSDNSRLLVPYAMKAADLDNDGKLDFAVVDGQSDRILVFWGTGSGTFSIPSELPIASSAQEVKETVAVAIGDADGDNDLDIFVANRRSHEVSFLVNRGARSFSAPIHAPVNEEPTSIAFGDVNADGLGDIVAVSGQTAAITVLLNTGRGGFERASGTGGVTAFPQSAIPSLSTVTLADFVGDSVPDLAITNQKFQQIRLLENQLKPAFHVATINSTQGVAGLAFGIRPPNHAPTLSLPISDQSTNEDAFFDFTVPAATFADVDIDVGDALVYIAARSDGSALPSWLHFDAANSRFTGTLSNADVGTVDVTVTAKDSNNASASDTFRITVTNTSDAPTVANPIPDQNAIEDQAFTFQFAANTFADVDVGDTLTYTASGLPGWLTFSASTRTFSGTPVNADVGTVDVTVTTKDSSNASVSDTFRITVTNTNDAPTVANPIPDQNAIEDQAFTFQFAANTFGDVDVGDTLTYTASGLPGWLTFSASTRTFSGTPANADVGTVDVTVTAKDSSNASASDTFRITVVNTNDAPIVANPIPDQEATQDSPFVFEVPANTFDDPDVGDALALSVDPTWLPSWLSFNPTTEIFSGTPKDKHIGTTTIEVTVTDLHGARTTSRFKIVVTDINDPPSVSLSNVVTMLPESTDTSIRVKVADITVIEDALGTPTLSLSGLDKALFVIQGVELFLKAGAKLDFETKQVLNVTVQVDDPTVGIAPDDFVNLSISVTDVNEAPGLPTLTPASIAENTDTSDGAITIGTLSADDPDRGEFAVHTFTLVSGVGDVDNDRFTITGDKLQLKQNELLDFEVQASYSVRVKVSEGANDVEQSLMVTVIDVNDYYNKDMPLDVDRTMSVEPLDALIIINHLNSTGPGRLPRVVGIPYALDTNDDGSISPIDVLLIINWLNGPNFEGEGTPNEVQRAQIPIRVFPDDSANISAVAKSPNENDLSVSRVSRGGKW
jgi:hypothetical protein